jgi:NADP-dependent aldehyde dehydrogenase
MTVVLESDASKAFVSATASQLKACPAGTTVQPPIKAGYDSEVDAKVKTSGVDVLGRSEATTDNPDTAVQPILLATDSKTYRSNEHLSAEIFGPSTLAVSCGDKEDMYQLARDLEGHLTASIFGDEEDFATYGELISILQEKAGRVIINQYPTGVEVCPSMVHGGPFPSSSDTRTSSVGTMAIDRFVRPVSFQNFGQNLLPDELKDSNPLGIWRTVDGELSK